ncbi:P-loop ATPase, Sll1717 family [Micromonospora echinospora]|uniref:P-loop ATPase, Sll1717 family n=1 Tax=Micromonospora echinospora TaxID=1877 RepID=UPI00379C9693
MLDITRLYFGRASAERDVLHDPDRFVDTYLDRWNLPDRVLDQETFLILGPKGSGKSAAAHYVALRWKREIGEHAVFTNFVDFDELNRSQSPLHSLEKKLVSGEVTALTDAAWKLFIGVRLLESLIKDEACDLSRDPHAIKLLADLKSAGLADDDYPKVLKRIRERKSTISIPRIASTEWKATDTESVSLPQLGDAVIRLAAASVTRNRHLLSIDGLDKAIGDNESYWRTLAALVRAADWISQRLLREGNRSIFLLIMCRNDVFRRIHFADSAKIAADGGINIDWGAEAQDPRDVVLWDYVARKARVDVDDLLNLLPDVVRVGPTARPISTLRYLLDFTRYTPRDMNLLFGSLKGRAFPGNSLSIAQVRSAADSFSSSHLLSEILSEATGLLDQQVINRLPQILTALPGKEFTREALGSAIESTGTKDLVTLDDLAEYLFLQGAIGNLRPGSGYVQFYHRRNTYDYNRSGPWLLHNGLMYALNIPFSTKAR